jgi:adenylate cyclase class 2
MYEVEVKFRADHDGVRERLAAADARRVGTVSQVDSYYDAPHRDFAATDEALRVRRERSVHEPTDCIRRGEWDEFPEEVDTRVTYKGPRVDEAKTREEFETGVDDDDALAGLLDGLGFAPVATVRKERERFAVDGYTVTLDAVADLGEFVEVEREVEEAAVDETREGAYDVARRLGLDPDDQIRESYLGMLLAGASGPAEPGPA